jgi:hypothetical protein
MNSRANRNRSAQLSLSKMHHDPPSGLSANGITTKKRHVRLCATLARSEGLDALTSFIAPTGRDSIAQGGGPPQPWVSDR